MFSRRINEEVINSLNESELYILKYINSNKKSVESMTIRDLSNFVSYSTATVSRFCKKIGYSGFSELKFELKLDNDSSVSLSSVNHHESIDLIFKDIRNTIKLLDPKLIDEIAHSILIAKNIHLFGVGISANTVSYFEKLLFSAGIFNVYSYSSTKLINHAISMMNQDDLVILTSATGEFKPAINTIKMAKISNIKTLTITPYNRNEIAQNSYYNLNYFGELRENNGAEFTNRITTFYILHTIFECIIRKKKEGYDENL